MAQAVHKINSTVGQFLYMIFFMVGWWTISWPDLTWLDGITVKLFSEPVWNERKIEYMCPLQSWTRRKKIGVSICSIWFSTCRMVRVRPTRLDQAAPDLSGKFFFFLSFFFICFVNMQSFFSSCRGLPVSTVQKLASVCLLFDSVVNFFIIEFRILWLSLLLGLDCCDLFVYVFQLWCWTVFMHIHLF